ncbi:MAG: hypothetical protein Tsb0010_06500 [Parvularculaceae bacterium]
MTGRGACGIAPAQARQARISSKSVAMALISVSVSGGGDRTGGPARRRAGRARCIARQAAQRQGPADARLAVAAKGSKMRPPAPAAHARARARARRKDDLDAA